MWGKRLYSFYSKIASNCYYYYYYYAYARLSIERTRYAKVMEKTSYSRHNGPRMDRAGENKMGAIVFLFYSKIASNSYFLIYSYFLLACSSFYSFRLSLVAEVLGF